MAAEGFSDDEKCRFFDKVGALYYDRNFGSTSKADIETLIFSEYLDHCLRTGAGTDDYTLSKSLGITQSRVRSLKERKGLKYPPENFDWKAALAGEVGNARYVERDHSVRMSIGDVNVMNEIKHYIEERGMQYDCTLNAKQLSIPLDCLTEIFLDDADDGLLFPDEAKSKLAKLAKENGNLSQFRGEFNREGLKRLLMSASKEVIGEALKLMPFGGVANGAFNMLIKVIEEA